MATTPRLKSDNPVMLAPGRARLATSPVPTGVGGIPDDDGDHTRSILGSVGRRRAYHHEDIDRETDQFGGKIGQPFKSPVSIAILDDDALPVHISEFAQRLLKSSYTVLDIFSRGGRQKTDPRNLLRLLRVGGVGEPMAGPM